MSDEHLTDIEIGRLLAFDPETPDAARLEGHAVSCDKCAARIAAEAKLEIACLDAAVDRRARRSAIARGRRTARRGVAAALVAMAAACAVVIVGGAPPIAPAALAPAEGASADASAIALAPVSSPPAVQASPTRGEVGYAPPAVKPSRMPAAAVLRSRSSDPYTNAAAQVNVAIGPWQLAGPMPKAYRDGVELDPGGSTRESHFIRYIGKMPAPIGAQGTVMQTFLPDNYRGARMRFSASVRTADVERWAGLWMRVDGMANGEVLASDTMQKRPIRGTTDWAHYEVMLVVPSGAKAITVGLLLDGPGKAWMRDVGVEVAAKTVHERSHIHVRDY